MNKNIENEYEVNEKRLYFLFTRIHDNQAHKTSLTLLIDFFVNNNNTYHSLIDVSQKLDQIGIGIKPEAFESILKNHNFDSYFEISKDFNILTSFRLRTIQFEILKSYENYYQKLENYILNYLKQNQIERGKSIVIIEILLSTLFKRNLVFLKQLLTTKNESDFEKILKSNTDTNFEASDLKLYNDVILNSNAEFNEIIKVLLYKMFDFLKLHYNPNIDESLNSNYKNKVFYLDSSFIIRLFGFDNELRELRTLELVNILKKIDGVKFLVHNDTLNEIKSNVIYLIDRVSKLLIHEDKSLFFMNKLESKSNDTINLYLRLKKKGLITGKEDFKLYFSNVFSRLKILLGSSVEKDDKQFTYSKEKFEDLIQKLNESTDKSKIRTEHISKLLLHIDNIRGSNNYNVYDIKHWLITSDNATSKVDATIRELSNEKSKSVCILPSELLRTISNKSEISGDYMEVFKKFMIYTNSYAEDYNDQDIKTIDKVLTFVEAVKDTDYDVDYYLTAVFQDMTLADISKRLGKFNKESEEREELAKIFEEKFGGNYKEKYLSFKERVDKITMFISKALVFILFYSLVFVSLMYFLTQLKSPNFKFYNPLTYINEVNWSKLEFIVYLWEIGIVTLCTFLYKKFSLKCQNWLFQKQIVAFNKMFKL